MQLALDQQPAVEARLRELGWIDSSDSIEALAVAGDGNMNVTLRAKLTSGSLILKQAPPFVAKYPEIPAPIERLDVEAAFYQAVGGYPDVAAAMPKLIGYDRDNHLLALEDLGDAADLTGCYDVTARQEPLPGAELLQWLGALHSAAVDDFEDAAVFANLEMRKLNHAHIFEIPLDPDNGLTLAPELTAPARAFAGDRKLKHRAAELGALYLADATQVRQPALLHGDYYPGSWLRTTTGICIIDFEFAFIGPAEFDLGVFMAHNIMSGMDPALLPERLHDYQADVLIDTTLTRAFAAMEIVRRLLGVAQLPLTADAQTKIGWLEWSREALTA